MRQEWKPGDPVVVGTINKGLPRSSDPRGYKGPDKTEAWAGKIVGPLLMGPGWWNVQRTDAKGGGGGVYAVPDGEIRPSDRK